jgi:hypothetical protein
MTPPPQAAAPPTPDEMRVAQDIAVRFYPAITPGVRDDLVAAIAAALSTTAARYREARQQKVADWCAAAFGEGQAASIEQRGIRLLEEAIEAYQACGASADMAHKMVDYIFARPAGTIGQELGGVGVTTLALANAAGLSADDCEAKEVARVLAKPLSHFTARNQAKNNAGFRAAAILASGLQTTPQET